MSRNSFDPGPVRRLDAALLDPTKIQAGEVLLPGAAPGTLQAIHNVQVGTSGNYMEEFASSYDELNIYLRYAAPRGVYIRKADGETVTIGQCAVTSDGAPTTVELRIYNLGVEHLTVEAGLFAKMDRKTIWFDRNKLPVADIDAVLEGLFDAFVAGGTYPAVLKLEDQTPAAPPTTQTAAMVAINGAAAEAWDYDGVVSGKPQWAYSQAVTYKLKWNASQWELDLPGTEPAMRLVGPSDPWDPNGGYTDGDNDAEVVVEFKGELFADVLADAGATVTSD